MRQTGNQVKFVIRWLIVINKLLHTGRNRIGKITDINITVEKAKTTVSLGGVELGSKGGGEEFITVGDFMNWDY